ncbi:MAG: transcriptional regulator [Betaproteobacteria bacterium]
MLTKTNSSRVTLEGRGFDHARTYRLGRGGPSAQAYVHRLETGEKMNPSPDLVGKLLKVLKASERDADVIKALVEQPDADPALVEYVLADQSIGVQLFTAAAGVRHRGTARPDPAILIARVKRFFEEDAE